MISISRLRACCSTRKAVWHGAVSSVRTGLQNCIKGANLCRSLCNIRIIALAVFHALLARQTMKLVGHMRCTINKPANVSLLLLQIKKLGSMDWIEGQPQTTATSVEEPRQSLLGTQIGTESATTPAGGGIVDWIEVSSKFNSSKGRDSPAFRRE